MTVEVQHISNVNRKEDKERMKFIVCVKKEKSKVKRTLAESLIWRGG